MGADLTGPSPAELRARVAATILALSPDRFLRVGVDGVDGVGKTCFADDLAIAVRALGRPVLRASADGFLNPRMVRYRLGRESPEGFYRDTYDRDALRRCLLDPLAPGGSGCHRRAVFDAEADVPCTVSWEQAPPQAALILDGMFLHDPGLRDAWDLSILLVAPPAVTVPRGAARGPGYGSPDPAAPSNHRYVEGQRRYFAASDPAARAHVVIDYSDLAAPRVLAWRIDTPRQSSLALTGMDIHSGRGEISSSEGVVFQGKTCTLTR